MGSSSNGRTIGCFPATVSISCMSSYADYAPRTILENLTVRNVEFRNTNLMFSNLRTVNVGFVQTISLLVLNLLNLSLNFTHSSMLMTLDFVISWKEGLLTALNLPLMGSDIVCTRGPYMFFCDFLYVAISCYTLELILIVIFYSYFSRTHCYKLKRELKPVFVADLFVVALAQRVRTKAYRPI